MNNLRIPSIILGVIIIVLAAWYFFSGWNSAPTPAQSTATTTASVQDSSTPTPDQATAAANIVGTWQSTDDPNYSIVVTAGGKWTDLYGGSATSSVSETGTYELFTSAAPDPDFTGVLVPGVVYMKVAEGSTTYYYSVLEASASQLQLSYLDRGNTLSFSKVQ